jgi:L,D-transpeptidase catalytic domain
MSVKTLATMATAVVASIAFPAGAAAQAPQPAQLSVQVQALHGGKRPALARTTAVGTSRPYVPGQQVRVKLVRDGRVVTRRWVNVHAAGDAGYGTFRLRSRPLIGPGRYRVRVHKPATAAQTSAGATSEPFRLRYPALTQGDHGRAVKVLHRLLRKQRYHAPRGGRFTAATARAVLAFRKVNWMAWGHRASREVVRRLASGHGAFKLRHAAARRHVEVDLDRQVMVLAARGKPQHTFHISSGAPSTPSDRGHFRFYRRLRGYNASRMLDPVYYNRGEAVHGYHAVPPYPASHGCIRTPIPDARFIHNWIRLGMSIYLY